MPPLEHLCKTLAPSSPLPCPLIITSRTLPASTPLHRCASSPLTLPPPVPADLTHKFEPFAHSDPPFANNRSTGYPQFSHVSLFLFPHSRPPLKPPAPLIPTFASFIHTILHITHNLPTPYPQARTAASPTACEDCLPAFIPSSLHCLHCLHCLYCLLCLHAFSTSSYLLYLPTFTAFSTSSPAQNALTNRARFENLTNRKSLICVLGQENRPLYSK